MRKLIFLVLLMTISLAGGIPVLAQGDITPTPLEFEAVDVVYDGFSVVIPRTFGANLAISRYAGDDPDSALPGGPLPARAEWVAYDGTQPPAPFGATMGLFVFNAADFADYPESAEQMEVLRTLLDERPDLSEYTAVEENVTENALPFLPVVPAAQVVRARAEYLETLGFSGIAYVTAFVQDMGRPFFGTDFIYTFQGISADGTKVVSAMVRLNTELFPETLPDDFDPLAFNEDLHGYLAESVTLLNDAAPDAFSPSLDEARIFFETFDLFAAG